MVGITSKIENAGGYVQKYTMVGIPLKMHKGRVTLKNVQWGGYPQKCTMGRMTSKIYSGGDTVKNGQWEGYPQTCTMGKGTFKKCTMGEETLTQNVPWGGRPPELFEREVSDGVPPINYCTTIRCTMGLPLGSQWAFPLGAQ